MGCGRGHPGLTLSEVDVLQDEPEVLLESVAVNIVPNSICLKLERLYRGVYEGARIFLVNTKTSCSNGNNTTTKRRDVKNMLI
jgi:hypothetical protein